MIIKIFKDDEMHDASSKNVLLLAMPFAGTDIPSIPLAVLETYLKERSANIKTRHLYLKAAEFYGLKNYNFLINPPNDSYTAQMIFSKYIFPDYWNNTVDRCREYFNRQLSVNKELQKKYGIKSIGSKKGDKIRIARGQFKGKTGGVESIDLKKEKVTITSIEMKKKDRLFNKKKVKKYLKSKGVRSNSNLFDGTSLNNAIIDIIDRVIKRVKENTKRK